MFSSVRVRLTLWYAAVMTGVLVLLAGITYFILDKNAIHRTDLAVAEQAESFLKTVNAEVRDDSGPGNLQAGVSVAISEHRFRDTFFIVLDESGAVVATTEDHIPGGRGSDDRAEPLPDIANRIARRDPQFQTVQIGRRAYRSYFEKFTVERKNCVLVVLQSLHPQEEFLETLSGTFLLVIPLAILLASLGGYFLARRSLSPVAAMGMQAGRINADNLHERLSVANENDELGQLALSFNGLLDRLDRAFEQQRRFVADASHELRTPVAILCGEAEVTLSQVNRSPEEYRESLTILRAEALRLKHIVEDLFTLARADTGQYALSLTDFYLDELLAECARNMRTLAASKHVALCCDASQEMLIRADESLVRRMILNLVDNAIKYSTGGGQVRLSVKAQNGNYQITVLDTGAGIPNEVQSRIFERFFRADKVRSRTESDGGGAGLGLSISLWIAQAHQGRLELVQSNSMGTIFSIQLPKSQS